MSTMGAPSSGADRPPRRTRPVWLLVFVVVLGGGGFSLIHGIIEIVRQNDAVLDRAVAEGSPEREARPVTFAATRSQEYSVYVIIDTSSSDYRDRIVRNTSCRATFVDGSSAEFSGARQSFSSTIGDTSSVGTFTAPEGRVTVGCVQGTGGSIRFIVSPGTVSIGAPVAFIIGGAFALAFSVFAGIKAFSGRRRARRRGWAPTA
jgi:hypothetical protein